MSCWGWELSSGQSYLFFGKHQNKRRIWRFWKFFVYFSEESGELLKLKKGAKTLKNQNKRERDKNYWDSGSFSQFVTVTNFSMCFRILIKDIMNSSSGQKPFCFFCIYVQKNHRVETKCQLFYNDDKKPFGKKRPTWCLTAYLLMLTKVYQHPHNSAFELVTVSNEWTFGVA